VPGAIIHLLVQTISSRKQVMIRKVVATDDQGNYRLFDLPRHLLSFRCCSEPDGVISETADLCRSIIRIRRRAFAADPVKTGREFVANFALRRAAEAYGDCGWRHQGRRAMAQATGVGHEGPEGSSVSALRSGRSGHDILHIQPGRYKLVVVNVESINTLAEWVEVGSQDVTVSYHGDPPEIRRRLGGRWDPASLRGATLALASFSDVSIVCADTSDGSVKMPMPSGRYEIVLARRTVRQERYARNARMVDGMVELPESGRCDSISWPGDGAS